MNKRSSNMRHECGQTLVLFALLATTLIAFVSLAIDGGMAYAVRRQAQNAADAAALTGVRYLLSTTSPAKNSLLAEVNQLAEQNKIKDTNGQPHDHINLNVIVYYTDANGSRLTSCADAQTCSTVPSAARGLEVVVLDSFQTFFGGIVGWPVLQVRASALATIRPSTGSAGTFALFAVGPCAGDGIRGIDGSGSVSEVIGRTHTNDTLYLGGSDYHFHGLASYVTSYYGSGSNQSFFEGMSQVAAIPNPLAGYMTSDYAPGGRRTAGRIVHNLSSGGKVDVGRLRSAGLYNSSTGALATGIYFAGNHEIDLGDSNMHGTVTLVSNNYIKSSGSHVRLTAYADGIVMFSDRQPATPCKDWVIDLGGSGSTEPIVAHPQPGTIVVTDNRFSGVIYAPRGMIQTSGSKSTFQGGLVGRAIKLNGSNELIMFDPNFWPPPPPSLELIR
jgi:Flp pilus assembly protein TadG